MCVVFGGKDGLFDPLGGIASEEYPLGEQAKLIPKAVKGKVLIIAAGNDNGLGLEGVKSCGGAGGAGADGVVDIGDAVKHAHLLQPVLHPGKGSSYLGADLVAGPALGGSESGQIVQQIVLTGQFDLFGFHHRAALTVNHAVNDPILAHRAVLHIALIAEVADGGFGKGGVVCTVAIIPVQHKPVRFRLLLKYCPFCIYVILEIFMLIQMIGRKVGDHRHIRAAAHTVQLERTQLQHGHIPLLDLPRLAQQRVADVSAQMHVITGSFQQLGNDGGGSGLAIAAGDGDDGAGTEGHEHLHLAGHKAAPGFGRFQVRVKGHKPRRAKNDVLIQTFQIVRAQLQLCTHGFQLPAFLAHFLHAALIAGCQMAALIQKQLDQRLIADADADHCDAFFLDAFNILVQSHRIASQTNHCSNSILCII